MTVIYRLIGYDRKTERQRVHYDLSPDFVSALRQLLEVPATDPEMIGAYPVDSHAIAKVAKLTNLKLDPDYDFFVQPFEIGDRSYRAVS